jgi:hypothetical protein
MKVRALSFLGLILLSLFCGCERGEARRARQVMGLVQTMGSELRTSAAQAAEAFTRRGDFEELRKAFGDDRFDAGTPLGPDFQGTLDSMIRELEGQLGKEPKDSGFLRKAVRQIRLFSQWWTFIRQQLEARRDQLVQNPQGAEATRLLGGRVRREDVLMVLSDTIRTVGAFEAITARCVRRIEEILTRS